MLYGFDKYHYHKLYSSVMVNLEMPIFLLSTSLLHKKVDYIR